MEPMLIGLSRRSRFAEYLLKVGHSDGLYINKSHYSASSEQFGKKTLAAP